ncbi:TIGR04222 domain-containing membrane protein, partial [Streptomyces sp. T-3]|nr:TIGR04222 domain-containing membrane protein [Streptomyces sp. T-3]
GPGRVVDASLAALHEDGRMRIAGPGIVAVLRAEARNPVEAAILEVHAAAPSGALHWLRIGVMRHGAVQSIGDRLKARGLMANPQDMGSLPRRGGTLALLSFLGFPAAIALTAVQFTQNDAPEFEVPLVVAVLPAIIAGIIGGIVIVSRAQRRVTPAGRAALQEFRRIYAYLPEAVFRVALTGLNGILDPQLRAQLVPASRHRVTARSSSSDGGLYAAGVTVDVNWCGGGDGGSSCGSGGGSSCGGSSGGSSCGGGS